MMLTRSIFTSQSPAWMAASFNGTLSHITEPTRSTTGNPTHISNPRPTAPINPATPTRPNKTASTYATTKLRTSSTSIIQTGGLSDASPSIPNSLSRSAPNTMYHSVLATNATTTATTIARWF